MKKITDFIKSKKLLITWTIFYISAMFLVLYFLFGFNMLSYRHWWILFHAQLQGFAGFVFGILILSAIPLYIATSLTVQKTKSLLFLSKLSKTKNKEEEKKKEEEKQVEIEPLPDHIPTEMRDSFLIARRRLKSEIESEDTKDSEKSLKKEDYPIQSESAKPDTLQSDKPTISGESLTSKTPEIKAEDHNKIKNTTGAKQPNRHNDLGDGKMPLPNSFDPQNQDETTTETSVPMFKSFDFSDKDKKIEDKKPSAINLDVSEPESQVSDYLDSKKIPFKKDNGIILTDKLAIAEHSDKSFWIADSDVWFAEGKQKESPIILVTRKSRENKLKPVIYISSDNILDYDTLSAGWAANGIKVITDISDLN